MKKRILSFLLVVCMLLPLIPFSAISVLAQEGAAITVSFIDANVSPAVTVSQQAVNVAGFFTVPQVPDDAFGWYCILPNGLIREASTYLGHITEDMTFYLTKHASTFHPSQNWPLYTSGDYKTALQGIFHGYRGGWTVGSYIDDVYTRMTKINEYTILENKGIWSHGGIYLDEGRMVTQRNGMLALSYHAPISGEVDIDFEALRIDRNTDGAVYSDVAMAIAVNGVIVWPQSAAGKPVSNHPVTSTPYTFPYIYQSKIYTGVYYDAPVTDWAYLELPSVSLPENYTNLYDLESLNFDWTAYCKTRASLEAELLAAVEAGSMTAEQRETELANYDSVYALCRETANYTKTGDLLAVYEAFCKESTSPHDIRVNAGDRIDIVFSRVNTPHISAYPTVTYTRINDQSPLTIDYATTEGEGSTLSAADDLNWPHAHRDEAVTVGTKGAYVLDSDFTDGWSFIGYHNGAVAQQVFDTAYASYGEWPTGILWLDDTGLSRTAVEGKTKDFQHYGVGFAYDLPYSGTVKFDAAFQLSQASGTQAIYFSVLRVNAEGVTVVYPASGETGDQIADVETEGAGIRYLTSGAKQERSNAISVKEGDRLVFVWRDACIMEHTGYYNRDFASQVSLTVSYEKKLSGHTRIYDPQCGYATPSHTPLAGTQVTYTDGWDLVGHSLSAYEPAKQIGTVSEVTASETWFSDGYTGSIWSAPKDASFTYIGPNRNWPVGYGVIPTIGAAAGWRYTSESSGKIDLTFLSLQSQHSVGSNGYVAVFHNGKMIWPMAEEEGDSYYSLMYSDFNGIAQPAKWAKIGSYKTPLTNEQILALPVADGSAATGSLSGIAVKEGDQIEILCRNDGSATSFWNSNSTGYIGTFAVFYEKKLELEYSFSINSMPAKPDNTVEENYSARPIFEDEAWSFVAFPKSNISETAAYTDYVAMNRNSSSQTAPWDDAFWGINDPAWAYDNDNNVAFRIVGGHPYWGETNAAIIGRSSVGGYRYTTPYAGKINIDITRLFTMELDNTDENGTPVKNGNIFAAIYVNNEKIWPSGEDWYALAEQGVDYAESTMLSAEEALTGITVGKGATVDFLLRSDLRYASRGTVFHGAVAFQETYPVSLQSAITLGSAFKLAITANAPFASDLTVSIPEPTVSAKELTNPISYSRREPNSYGFERQILEPAADKMLAIFLYCFAFSLCICEIFARAKLRSTLRR